MANSYTIGTLVQMSATFTTAGANADPSGVVGTVRDAAGVETTPTVTRDAVGAYHMDFTTVIPGVHYYRFMGTGSLVVAGESSFVVTPSSF